MVRQENGRRSNIDATVWNRRATDLQPPCNTGTVLYQWVTPKVEHVKPVFTPCRNRRSPQPFYPAALLAHCPLRSSQQDNIGQKTYFVQLLPSSNGALAAQAPGSFAQFSKLSSIQEATTVPSAQDMLRQLVSDNETADRTLRETANIADEVNDLVTADLMTERMAVHEKAAWMMRSVFE